MVVSPTELASSSNALANVACLEAYWASLVAGGMRLQLMLEKVLLDTLGLGNQQVLAKLHSEHPDFQQFCDWIMATVGMPDPALLARYHAWLLGHDAVQAARALPDRIAAMPEVLDAADLRHWDEHGYVVVSHAISPEEAAAVRALIWAEIGGTPDDPQSWYTPRPDGIMIARFQHSALEAARRSPRVHKAFAQLWGTEDLWVTIDRIGFNPPERLDHPFAGSDLHWDVSLAQPIPFGTQAVLYLNDTAANQGAFRCVPGFHRRIDGWLGSLGDVDPRRVDLSAEQIHVGGNSGDLIIWRQDLPHGASPNRSDKPRLVQYLNYYSPDMVVRERWR